MNRASRVVFLELVSGKAPFRSDSMAPLFAEIVNTGPVPLAALRADAPAPLWELSRRMVAINPAARTTAAQVVVELDGLELAGGVRRAHKSGPSTRSCAVRSVPPASAPGGGASRRAARLGLVLFVLVAAAGASWRPRRAAVEDPLSPAAPVAVPGLNPSLV